MPHGIYWIILVICWGSLGLFWVAGWYYNLWKAPVVQRTPSPDKVRSLPPDIRQLIVDLKAEHPDAQGHCQRWRRHFLLQPCDGCLHSAWN